MSIKVFSHICPLNVWAQALIIEVLAIVTNIIAIKTLSYKAIINPGVTTTFIVHHTLYNKIMIILGF